MKVLYVSDLDGTLLNRNQVMNQSTIDKLNELIDRGVHFTVCTGRGASAKKVVQDLHLKLPIMVLNGALNYDNTKNEYINKKVMPVKTALEIIDLVNSIGFEDFQIQTLEKEEILRIPVSEWDKKSECIAFNVLNDKEKMDKIKQGLKQISGINFFTHKNVYINGMWFCDVNAENVSKATCLKTFKEQYKFDKVIAFGDGENDLPMAQIADEFYAVENASDTVKQNATGVIGSGFDDGVANYILECECEKLAN